MAINKKFITGILLLVGILIASLIPFAAATGAVSISPVPAYTNDTLSCNVASGEGYIYQWYKNSQTSVTTQTVNPDLTTKNDAWRCVVKKYLGPQVGTITIGEDSITIQNSIPYWNPVPDNQTIDEDTSLNYQVHADDTDADERVDTIIYYISESDFNIDSQTGLITWTPPQDSNLERWAYITAGDGTTNITQMITITINPINDAPVWNSTWAGSGWYEDSIILENLSQYFYDPDGDILTYTNTPLTNILVDINQTTGIATFTPNADWNGFETIQFTATDPSLASATSGTINLTVWPVNDAPIISALPDITFNEDEFNDTLNLSLYVTDIENDTITWTFSGNTNVNVAILPDNTVNFTSLANWSGNEIITFTANDSMNTTSANLTVFVLPVNDAPFQTANIPNQTWDEDTNLTIDLSQYFSDVDNATLLFASDVNDSNVIITIDGLGQVNITANANWNGVATATFNASDGEFTAVSNVITLNVTSVNDAPTWTTSIANQTIAEDSGTITVDANLSDNVADVENDPITFLVQAENTSEVDCNISGVELNITPAGNFSGIASCTIRASDSTNYSDTTFYINVTPVNDPPYQNATIPNMIVDEDSFNDTINLYNYFSDIDNLTLTFTSEVNDSNVTININQTTGQVNITALANWTGTASAYFNASDGEFNATSNNITINVMQVNDPPIFTGTISDISFSEDMFNDTINLSNYFSDIDNATLIYSYAVNDTNVTADINQSTGQVNITSAGNWSGIAQINFTASDGQYNATSNNVIITVNPVNDPPYLQTNIPDITFNEDYYNDSINLNDYFKDIDNATLIFNSTVNDSNITITINAGGNVNFTSANNWYGAATANFTANDSEFNLTSNTITINVNSINDAPNVSDIPDISFNEDEFNDTLDLDDYVTDVENDTITWTFSGNTNVQVQILAGNIVNFTATGNWSGIETITFTANDSKDTDSDNVTVTVIAQNDAPIFSGTIANQTWDINTTNSNINLSNYFSDIDSGDDLNWTASSVANITVNINNSTGQVTLTPDAGWTGTRYVTFTAFDNAGANATSNNVTLTVVEFSNITNSYINTIFFTGTNYSDFTWADIRLSNINISNVTNSQVNSSNVTNSAVYISRLRNSTVIDSTSTNCSIYDSQYIGGTCINSTIEPSIIINSTTTGSTISNSNITDSNATYSTVANSTINSSDVNSSAINLTAIENSTVLDSDVQSSNITDGSYLTNATLDSTNITDSWIENANLTNSTFNDTIINNSVINDSVIIDANVTDANLTNATLTNSSAENVTINNSVIVNSSVDDTILENANITNDIIYNGTIVMANGTVYNASESGPQNLTELINYAPWVSIISPSNESSIREDTLITFGINAGDVNIGTMLNDSIIGYLWNFGDGDSSNQANTTHEYSNQGTYTVTVTVTDSFNETDSYSIILYITARSRGGAGAGGEEKVTTLTNVTNVTNITQLQPPICQEDWVCNDWNACINNSQARTCSDKNSCGTTTSKPSTTRACEAKEKKEAEAEAGFFKLITGNAILNTTATFIKGIPSYLVSSLIKAINFLLELLRTLREVTKLLIA